MKRRLHSTVPREVRRRHDEVHHKRKAGDAEHGDAKRQRTAQQALVQREQALVQREQALVQREQALAAAGQALVQREQALVQALVQREQALVQAVVQWQAQRRHEECNGPRALALGMPYYV